MYQSIYSKVGNWPIVEKFRPVSMEHRWAPGVSSHTLDSKTSQDIVQNITLPDHFLILEICLDT